MYIYILYPNTVTYSCYILYILANFVGKKHRSKESMWIGATLLHWNNKPWSYCWWFRNLANQLIFSLSRDLHGFSQVVQDFFHQQKHLILSCTCPFEIKTVEAYWRKHLYCWFQKKVVRIIRTLSNIKCICYVAGVCWKFCDSLLPTTLYQTQTRNTNPTWIISISYQNNIDFLVGGWSNPSEKIGSTYKLDHFPKSFGVNIPKIFELPSPSPPSHDLPMHLSIWALISLILRILNLAWHSNVVCCSAAARATWDVASSNGWWVKGCGQPVPSDEFLNNNLSRAFCKTNGNKYAPCWASVRGISGFETKKQMYHTKTSWRF